MSAFQAELFDAQDEDLLVEPKPARVAAVPPAPAEAGPGFEVRVVRSAKRRKTIQARMANGALEVLVPAWMNARQEAEAVDAMVERFSRKQKAAVIDLERRAATLAERHGLRTPRSIRWVDNQQWRWGSCTPVDGTIRISSRMAEFPTWVLDAVIVHELAHLDVFGHGPDFYELADRYPLAERAKGFLIAKGLDH